MMEPPLAGGGLGGHPEDGAAYATLLNTVESLQADLQRQRNEVAQHREIVKETIGGMTELADATKKEIDDLTDKMQAELAEVKFCHELSR